MQGADFRFCGDHADIRKPCTPDHRRRELLVAPPKDMALAADGAPQDVMASDVVRDAYMGKALEDV